MKLRVVTPSGVIEREVDSLRALEGTGSFGVMARHADMLSVLEPSILAYTARGKAEYIAVDGGILRVEGGEATIAARRAVEGEDVSGLTELIRREFARAEEKEASFLDLLSNMEKLLLDRMVKFERG